MLSIRVLILFALIFPFQGCVSNQVVEESSSQGAYTDADTLLHRGNSRMYLSSEEKSDESENQVNRRPDTNEMGGIASMRGTSSRGAGPLTYSITLSRPQVVSGQDETLGSISHKLSARVPVWRSRGNMLFLTAGIESVQFRTEAVFPESGTAFPDKVWNLNAGAVYSHRFANGWASGVMVNLSTSSDQPFDSFDELKVGGTAFLRIPSGADNSWRFMLRYSPRSEITRVLPGVSYSWRPNESLQLNIGIPFQVSWRLSSELLLDAFYAPVTRVGLKTVWHGSNSPVTLILGFDWNGRSSTLADRINEEDRFSGNEKTVSIGGQYDFTGFGSLELTGGYAFDRYFYIGENFSDCDDDRIEVEPGAFIKAGFSFAFGHSSRGDEGNQ